LIIGNLLQERYSKVVASSSDNINVELLKKEKDIEDEIVNFVVKSHTKYIISTIH